MRPRGHPTLEAILLAILGGCDDKSDVASAAAPATVPASGERLRGVREAPPFDCAKELQDYLSARGSFNSCERDGDCAEIWPGLCPHGPYYVRRSIDLDPVVSERRIAARCEIPKCEPPKRLGIARCEQERCVAGRPPPQPKPGATCQPYEVNHLEADGVHEGTTVTEIRTGVPRVVVAPVGRGTLRVAMDWPTTCKDCTLFAVSGERGDEQADAKVVRSEDVTVNGHAVRRDHYEMLVFSDGKLGTSDGAPLTIVPRSGKPVAYRMSVDLRDRTDHPGAVRLHGTSWETECEATR